MRTLLDTCVISEIRKPQGQMAVKTAVMQLPSTELFLSVITIGEIAKGIAMLTTDMTRQKNLQIWLEGLQYHYTDRILRIDSEIAMIWGDITAQCQHKGVMLSATDGLIAATAKRHGLRLMTRNTRDFIDTGVMLMNPWENA